MGTQLVQKREKELDNDKEVVSQRLNKAENKRFSELYKAKSENKQQIQEVLKAKKRELGELEAKRETLQKGKELEKIAKQEVETAAERNYLLDLERLILIQERKKLLTDYDDCINAPVDYDENCRESMIPHEDANEFFDDMLYQEKETLEAISKDLFENEKALKRNNDEYIQPPSKKRSMADFFLDVARTVANTLIAVPANAIVGLSKGAVSLFKGGVNTLYSATKMFKGSDSAKTAPTEGKTPPKNDNNSNSFRR